MASITAPPRPVVAGEPWEVCDGRGFTGRCVVLQPGRYEKLRDMNDGITSVGPVSARGGPVGAPPPPPVPERGGTLTLYERRDFRGASINIDRPRRRLERADLRQRRFVGRGQGRSLGSLRRRGIRRAVRPAASGPLSLARCGGHE
jgi:hypothetical protein